MMSHRFPNEAESLKDVNQILEVSEEISPAREALMRMQ
jgi:hypothetical protein